METALKISLGAIILLLVGILGYNIFFVNKTLNDAIGKIQDSVHKIDTARRMINDSKLQLDTLQTRIDTFRAKKAVIDKSVSAEVAQAQKSNADLNARLRKNQTQIDAVNKAKSAALHPIPTVLPLDTF